MTDKTLKETLIRIKEEGGINAVAEALMGHKLPGSRGAYFDYHDLRFAADEYMRGFWNRIDIDRIRELEEEVGKLRTAKEQVPQKDLEIQKLKLQVESLKGWVNTELKQSRDEILRKLKKYNLTVKK